MIAGSTLRIGVEYRYLDPDTLMDTYGDDTVADQVDPAALVTLVEQVEELARRSVATRGSAVA